MRFLNFSEYIFRRLRRFLLNVPSEPLREAANTSRLAAGKFTIRANVARLIGVAMAVFCINDAGAFTMGYSGHIPSYTGSLGNVGNPPKKGEAGGGGVGYVGLPNSGVVHFFGSVRDSACTVSVSTPSSEFVQTLVPNSSSKIAHLSVTNTAITSYVILPDRTVADFPAVGSVSGITHFFITFQDCEVPRGREHGKLKGWPYFFGGHANASTGRLNNIPGIGQAVGVDLELVDLFKDAV